MATSTSALSALEVMLVSLIRGSGERGDKDTPVDDGLASPPPPLLPARPIPRGRPPSCSTVFRSAARSPVKEDASTTTDEDPLLAELERKAAEVEAQLQKKEEENAALKWRIESYHVEWLKSEIKIKSLEEACQEQIAALQTVQDAVKARADETARTGGRRESLESLMKMSEEPSAVRRRHGCPDRVVVGARRSISTVSRLESEFQCQSQAFDRGVAAALVVVEPSRPWQPAVPRANSVDDLKKLKAQFCAWKKDYKARLRRAKAELDKDRRHRGVCWI